MSRKMIDYQAEGGKIKSIDGYKVGGDFSVKVDKIESNWSASGGSNSPYWDNSYENKRIEPNKHYDYGFSTIICYDYEYNTVELQPNQFIIPIGGDHLVGPGKRIMQYGEVVLQLNSVDTQYALKKQTNGYNIKATYYLTYTVVTPGTTGDTVQLPPYFAGYGPRVSYEVVTLGVAEA